MHILKRRKPLSDLPMRTAFMVSDSFVSTRTLSQTKVDRNPRGRTITVAYLAMKGHPVDVQGRDDAANAEWHSIRQLPPLAFDHADIMQDAIKLFNAENR